MSDSPLNTDDLSQETVDETPPQPEAGDDAATEPLESDAASADADHESDDSGETGASSLEEEGEIAADYLEELLDIADIDGDIDIDVVGGRAQVAIVSDAPVEGLRQLVGPGGRVVDALQELTRLVVQTTTGERSRLMLDIDNFRAERRDHLSGVAGQAIEEIRGGAEQVALAPMNAFERKIVHDAVAEAGLRSESEGQGDGRHVVVFPA